jgi:hypothetical protein
VSRFHDLVIFDTVTVNSHACWGRQNSHFRGCGFCIRTPAGEGENHMFVVADFAFARLLRKGKITFSWLRILHSHACWGRGTSQIRGPFQCVRKRPIPGCCKIVRSEPAEATPRSELQRLGGLCCIPLLGVSPRKPLLGVRCRDWGVCAASHS